MNQALRAVSSLVPPITRVNISVPTTVSVSGVIISSVMGSFSWPTISTWGSFPLILVILASTSMFSVGMVIMGLVML